MAYCTQDDLNLALAAAELAQLADDTAGVSPDADVLARAIASAEAEVDAYLAPVADLPLTTVPDLVREITVQIALYRLFLRRNLGSMRQEEYDRSRATLDLIRAGKLLLWDDDDESSPTTVGVEWEAI